MGHDLVGVWLLERADGLELAHPLGLLVVTADGWCSIQVASHIASAGHYGVDGDRFLVDPVVALVPDDAGRIQQWRWSFEGDVLVLASPTVRLQWHRADSEVVTGLGAE